MKIKGKFTLAFVSIFTLVAIGSITTLWMNAHVEQQVRSMLNEHRVKYDLARQIQYESAVRAEVQRNLVIMTDPTQLDVERKKMKASADRYGERMKQLGSFPLSTQESEMIEKIRANGNETYVALGEFTSNLEADMKDEAVEVLYGSMREIQQRFFNLINEFTQLQEQALRQSEQDLASAMTFANSVQIVLAILMALLVSVVGVVLTRSIANPLVLLTEKMRSIALSTHFSQRLDLGHRSDEIGDSVQAFNQLMAQVDQSLTEVRSVMRALSMGDFTPRVLAPLTGDLEDLKNSVNQSAEAISVSMHCLSTVLTALQDGRFNVQADMGRLSGQYRQLVQQGVETANTLNAVVASVNETMHSLAEGDFGARVSAQATGDLNLLCQNINRMSEELSRAVCDIQALATALSQGKVAARVLGHYNGDIGKIAVAMNLGVDKIHTSLRDISEAAFVVERASAEVSDGSQDFSDRTQQQALDVQSATEAMARVLAVLQQNVASTEEGRVLASSTRQAAELGMVKMDQTVQAMQEIREANQRITGIVSLIDTIAFQTNLLALNAAVEAARAGEHGRGFAVVAGEVRTLAQKAAEAARDINVVVAQSVAKTAVGDVLVGETVAAFKQIQSRLLQTDAAIASISAGMIAQRTGAEGVGRSLNDMDARTQQNAALVEELSATATTLREQSNEMLGRVSVFDLEINTKGHH
jgi:methyl-accepting chemotaxis protein